MVVSIYSFEEIEKVTTEVVKKSDANNLDVDQITKKVVAKSKPSKKKITKAEMINYVLND